MEAFFWNTLYFMKIFDRMHFDHFRKYVKRQENLKKAISWWEDEDENPGLNYVDFSKRKILFDFGNFRRGSDFNLRYSVSQKYRNYLLFL